MSSYPDDTIVAISSPQGAAMRAIIRLSGPNALPVIEAFFEPDAGGDLRTGFSAPSGRWRLPGEKVSIPATLYVMRAPMSYTREDVMELHVPGSPALVEMVLDAILESFPDALRLAGPGEFTQRAFLNGRIDLAQAEAVLNIINARNKSELLAANAGLAGETSKTIQAVQNNIADLRATIEAALDFEAHEIEIISERDVLENCRKLRETLQDESGQRYEEPAGARISVALCGPPNAGKSSILNRLSGKENAIVHPTAGTTRDHVQENIDIDGMSFAFCDTAGLEDLAALRRGAPDTATDGDGIGALAARSAANLIRGARIVVMVFDASVPVPGSWKDIVLQVEKSRLVCVLNKCDLPQEAAAGWLSEAATSIVRVSALYGDGIGELRSTIAKMVTEGEVDASPSGCLFNARQRESVREAIARIQDAEAAVGSGLGYEFAALNLQEASDALGRVTGAVGNRDVLNRIFSRFCIGK